MPAAIAVFDLVPGPGLTPGPRPTQFTAARPRVGWTAAVPLAAGWYRVRVSIRTPDRVAVRKHAELSATFADGSTAVLERFQWNAAAAEDFVLNLPHPAAELRLDVAHAGGEISLSRFAVRRVTAARALARAVRVKVRLVSSYNCFWPVVKRGGRLLAAGRVTDVTRKLLKGIPDARTMRLDVKQAAEANAAWWRRRALPAARVAEIRAAVAADLEPAPVVVVIPIDATRAALARHAALSVSLQLYPHWQLRFAVPTAGVPDEVAAAAAADSRISVTHPPAGGTLRDAVLHALETAHCARAVILPPDWELAEHALYELTRTPAAGATGELPAGSRVRPAVLRTADLLAAPPPAAAGVAALIAWAAAAVPADATQVPEPLIVPMNAAGVATRPVAATGPRVTLGGHFRGLSGWDYVVYQTVKGLRSIGADVSRYPTGVMWDAVVPPHLLPPARDRGVGDAQIVVAPPFLLDPFRPDARTAVVTMWEIDRLTPAAARSLNNAGLVIVPSAWSEQTFRASGVTTPIAVVPLGYDPFVFYPAPAAAGPCVFGTAGALSAGGIRKNVARVVHLFLRAFPTQPDVRLRVKITPNCPPLDVPPDPRIDVCRESLPHPELAAWNRSLTAYVNASFAEGFGLHLLEAMACGRPLISTAYSGPTAYFDEQVGYVVPHTIVPAANDIYQGRWADPDDAGVVSAMRAVYADRAAAARLGAAAAARARRFTWRDFGRGVTAALRAHDFI